MIITEFDLLFCHRKNFTHFWGSQAVIWGSIVSKSQLMALGLLLSFEAQSCLGGKFLAWKAHTMIWGHDLEISTWCQACIVGIATIVSIVSIVDIVSVVGLGGMVDVVGLVDMVSKYRRHSPHHRRSQGGPRGPAPPN